MVIQRADLYGSLLHTEPASSAIDGLQYKLFRGHQDYEVPAGERYYGRTPPGPRFYLDEQFARSTPSILAVAPGKHAFRLYAAGLGDWSRQVNVLGGGDLTLAATLDKNWPAFPPGLVLLSPAAENGHNCGTGYERTLPFPRFARTTREGERGKIRRSTRRNRRCLRT